MVPLLKDFHYAARTLRKSPGFTLFAALALSLGIGANTAIFSLTNAVILRGMPYQHSDRLVWIGQTNLARGWDRTGVSIPDFLDFQRQSQSFDSLAAFQSQNYNLSDLVTGALPPERIRGSAVSAGLFSLLSVSASLGRTFLPEDTQPRQDHVVVLSHGLWQSRFGGDPGLIGRTVRLNGDLRTVIGVMPEWFQFPPKANPDALWIPLSFSPDDRTDAARSRRSLDVWAVLKTGVTRQQAEAELAVIAQRLGQEHPATNQGWGVRVSRMSEWYLTSFHRIVWLLLGAVALLLLIACANVANLLVAKAIARQREIAIRLALGASPYQIVRQMLAESLLLSLLGGAVGLLLAFWGVRALHTFLPPNFYRVGQIDIDGRVLGFTFAISLMTGVLFGLAPALGVARTDLNAVLKDGGRQGGGAMHQRLRGVLVVAEIAFSLVLLIGAGLLLSSFWRLQRADLGFQTERLLTFRVNLPESQYGDAGRMATFERSLLDRVQVIPGVESAAVANDLPLIGADNVGRRFMIEGQTRPEAGKEPIAMYLMVSPRYFQTLGIPVVRGRSFDDGDRLNSPGVVIVDETFVRQYLPGQNALGKQVRLLGPVFGRPDYAGPAVLEVVGVAAGAKHFSPSDRPFPHIYVPLEQKPWPRLAVAVRTRQAPGALADALRQTLQAVDPEQPAFSLTTLEARLGESLAQDRWNLTLIGIVAGLALALAAVGTYGVMAYFVACRRREIGVRLALGARRRDVVALVLRQAAMLTGTGLGVGLAAALALTRVMTGLLYEVKPHDPLVFLFVAIFLFTIGMVASGLPAWRATKVDPMVTLRN